MEFASSLSRFSDEEVSQREIPFMAWAAAMADDTGAAAAATSSSPPSAAGSAAALRSTDGGRSDDVEVIEKEHMFDKVVTHSDVGKLNRLVIPKQHAEKYFPLDAAANEKGLLLSFEDRGGKLWRFHYSYWNGSQSYVMTKGWSRFVKEKGLDAGDTVSFCRGAGEAARGRLFIDCKRRDPYRMHLTPSMVPVASAYGSQWYPYPYPYRMRLPLSMVPGSAGGFFSQQQALDFSNINAAATRSTPSLVVQTSHGLYTETVHEDSRYTELNILERIVNESEKPGPLDFTLLHNITENFSEKNKIGSGGCGIVYKGILRNGVVAVKKLHNSRTIKNKMFHREVLSLISVKHQNIVQFLGYCSFTKEHAVPYEGITIMADIRERLLCFEYISNGSLDKHLSDELRGLEWQTRYQIIIGICRGLHYLHKDKEIIHMDLKPGNILIDDLMVPKITDFGLSRPISDSQATTTLLISQGYASPEYTSRGKATSKSDIYSLGVIIIELLTGSRTRPNITKVIRRWNHRWIKSMKQSSLAYQQVKKCLELALRCIQDDPTDRPDISDIIDELKEIDTIDNQTQIQISPCCLEDILGIEPLEIRVPFEDLKMPHSIELTNDTDDYIAFVTKAKLERFCTEPDKGIVPPHSKCSVTLAMRAQVNVQPNVHYTEVVTVLSTRVDDGTPAAMDIVAAGDIFIDSEEGKVVDEVNVMVVFGTPELPEE